ERDGTPVDDAFDITFYYPHMRALLRATAMSASTGPRFWICGKDASFTKYGLDPQEDGMKAGGDLKSPDWGAQPESAWGKLTTANGEQKIPTIPGDYRPYYENVRDAILGKAKIAVTAEDALNVMRVLEMSIESSKKRCALPWPR